MPKPHSLPLVLAGVFVLALSVIAVDQRWFFRGSSVEGSVLVAQQQPAPSAAAFCPSGTSAGTPSSLTLPPTGSHATDIALTMGMRVDPGTYAFVIKSGAVSYWPSDSGNGGNAWTADAYLRYWTTAGGPAGALVNSNKAWRHTYGEAEVANRGHGTSITIGDRPNNQRNFDIFVEDSVNPGDNRPAAGDSRPSVTVEAVRCYRTFCGDGTVQNPNEKGGAEACDDRNTVNGDGCSADCLAMEPGWSCDRTVSPTSCFPYGPTFSNFPVNPAPTWSAGSQQTFSWFPPTSLAAPMTYVVGLVNAAGLETPLVSNTMTVNGTISTTLPIPATQTPGSYRVFVRIIKSGKAAEASQPLTIAANLCGNGVRDTGEACDDGNTTTGDGCTSQCASIEYGWDCNLTANPNVCTFKPVSITEPNAAGITWTLGSTRHFRWMPPKTAAYGIAAPFTYTVALKNAATNAETALPGLGNVSVTSGAAPVTGYDHSVTLAPSAFSVGSYLAVVHFTKAGKTVDYQGNYPFTIVNACGNGTTDPGEVCDDGDASTPAPNNGQVCIAQYGSSCTYCRSDCSGRETVVGPRCGNGQRDGSEVCDDGDASTPAPNNGQACTAGYNQSCDYCSTTCTAVHVVGPFCGDNTKNGTEQCDTDAHCSSSLACRHCSCVVPVDVTAPGSPETWTAGSQHTVAWSLDAVSPPYQVSISLRDSAGTSTLLASQSSGNGGLTSKSIGVPAGVAPGTYAVVVTVAKGAKNFTDWTDGIAIVNPCGNGTIEAGAGENCDDADTENGDGCSALCTRETGWTCNGTPSVCTRCSNGTIDQGEGCDDGPSKRVSGDGCSFPSCQVEAGWTCSFAAPSVCQKCGNGTREGTEQCENNGQCTAGNPCVGCQCLAPAQAARVALDVNGDGTVSETEAYDRLEAAANAIGTAITDTTRRYDVNASGTITNADLVILVQAARTY